MKGSLEDKKDANPVLSPLEVLFSFECCNLI